MLAEFAADGVYWFHYPTWSMHFIGEPGGDDLQVGDLNGDGALDAVTNGEQIMWVENARGSGEQPPSTLRPLHVIDAQTLPHNVVIRDVNGGGQRE
jgi:hypothetical protein